MRDLQDFEWVNLAVIPMFLFSATFFPVQAYPPAVRWVVEVTRSTAAWCCAASSPPARCRGSPRSAWSTWS